MNTLALATANDHVGVNLVALIVLIALFTLNKTSVDLEPLVAEADVERVRALLERHRDLTGSPRAAWVLEHWTDAQPRFIKIFPHEYKRVLGAPRVESVYAPPTTASPLVTSSAEVLHG